MKICIGFFDWPSEPKISQKYKTAELRLGKNPDKEEFEVLTTPRLLPFKTPRHKMVNLIQSL